MKNIEEKFEEFCSLARETSMAVTTFGFFKVGYETAKREYEAPIVGNMMVTSVTTDYISTPNKERQLEERLKEAEQALKFYCDPGHWGIDAPGKTTSIDPCDQEHYDDEYSNYGIRGGKRAREYFKKWSNDKSSQEG